MAILKRTIFMNQAKTYVRFADWALVTTSLGRMAEPFQYVGATHVPDVGFADYDANNEMNMINMIKPYSEDMLPTWLSGGAGRVNEGPTIGGNLTQFA